MVPCGTTLLVFFLLKRHLLGESHQSLLTVLLHGILQSNKCIFNTDLCCQKCSVKFSKDLGINQKIICSEIPLEAVTCDTLTELLNKIHHFKVLYATGQTDMVVGQQVFGRASENTHTHTHTHTHTLRHNEASAVILKPHSQNHCSCCWAISQWRKRTDVTAVCPHCAAFQQLRM